MNVNTTKKVKKTTAFRFDEELLARLKEEARKEKRSLNNYVECVLLDNLYYEPNDETLASMKDAVEGKYAGKIDASTMETFLKSFE